MPRIDPEVKEKFQVFVVFDANSQQIPRDFAINLNIINNKRTSHAFF